METTNSSRDDGFISTIKSLALTGACTTGLPKDGQPKDSQDGDATGSGLGSKACLPPSFVFLPGQSIEVDLPVMRGAS